MSETLLAKHYTPTPITVDESVARLKATLLKDIKRSAYLYRVDCGGCNGCEIEIFASITSLFDAERFGIRNTPSPRHADILIYTGSVTRMMRTPAIRAYHSAPDPKIVVSYGACGCGGGIFHDLYGVWGGTDKILPVDVWIPGCPPTPGQTIYGLAMALGLLAQKLTGDTHEAEVTEQALVRNPQVPLKVRVPIEREARRMAGYRQGRHISEHLLMLIEEADNPKTLTSLVNKWLKETGDPRLQEIVGRLMDVVQQEI